ncbi:hypothetical protein Taro_038688 [Colocasia esculenta]|uniref:Uncharacterized protein n=1 Tax=Colocasia esculenta TaxID=4460 RepID=A0A843WGJ5_COLES|nr:hypothetical protein [Colocasia esculenta]
MVQIADESSIAARTRQGTLSRSDRERRLCRDGPENATYRAIAFSGIFGWLSAPRTRLEPLGHSPCPA